MEVLRIACLLFVVWRSKAATPTWTNLDHTIEINENTAVSTSIYRIEATDSDGHALTYSQTNQLTNFQLSSQDVLLQFSPDYESGVHQYTITYSVEDVSNVATSGTLTVNILDVNEASPVISSSTINGTVNENKVAGSLVTITFTVSDADTSDVLFYSLSGTDKDKFNIDSSDGTITTATTFDRESVATYDDLLMKVSDGTHTSTATLTINVIDVNDNAPVFGNSLYLGSVTENAATGTSVASVTVDDSDEGTNKVFSLSIASGDTSSKFSISGNDITTTSTAVDYEAETSFTLVIKAVDTGSPALTGSTTIRITVIGQNEYTPAWDTFSPVWTDATTPFSLSENAAVGTTIVAIKANDDDDGTDGAISFELGAITSGPGGGSATGLFHLDSVTGDLTTIGDFDYENSDGILYYDVTVKAKDGGTPIESIERSIRVGLADFNDNAPSFDASSYQATVMETDPVGKTVITLSANDADSSASFSYTIADGNADDYFEFSSTSTNKLLLKSVIDLDNPTSAENTYNLKITVSDGGSPELTGTTFITITVTPANEHTPTFSSVIINETVPESSAIGYTVTSVSASDSDYGNDGEIEYSIVSGDTHSSFRVGSSDGRLTLIKTLDYETSSSYTLKIEAKDGGSSPLVSTCTVYVTVMDVNDNEPSCSSVTAIDLSETSAVGDEVVSLSCSDLDVPTTLTYSLPASITEFAVNSSGVITLASALDYDSTTKSYSFDVTVSDGAHTLLVPITVIVNAVNEFTPNFTTVVTETVAENVAVGAEITTFTAVDNDHSPHDIVSYSITSVTNGGTGTFSVDSNSGLIKLTKTLDFDTLLTKNYEITVVAEDGGGLKGTGTVTLSVTDVNDNTPSCAQSLYVLSVPENTSASAIIDDLQCTDADSDNNGNLTYSLTQNPGSEFSLVESGSTVSVNVTGSLDFERVSSYTLSVSVKDNGTTKLSTTVSIEIEITDVNDGGPTFSAPYNISVAEDTAVGTVLQTVTATDPDNANSSFGRLVYSIASGDTHNQFVIDSSSGKLSLIRNLDFETDSEYFLTVEATEQGGTFSASTYVNNTVTDVNDNIPECTALIFAVSIDESTSSNTDLLLFNCSDRDSGLFGSLSYSIIGGNTSVFGLSSNVLQLISSIDYESGINLFDIVVSVSDGTHNVNVSGIVAINDVNEAQPVFVNTLYTVTVPENITVGTTVIRVNATDSDLSDTLEYTITSTTSVFKINQASGGIILNRKLDRETTQSYFLGLSVSDGTFTNYANLSIDVADINDNAPLFSPVSYSGSVSENDVASASVIVTVSATDADDPNTDANAEIQYIIVDGDPSGIFQLNSSTGELRTTVQLDYETTEVHSLTIRAFDRNGDSESLSSTAFVTIRVSNENEFNPMFNDTFSASVEENIAIGTSVIRIFGYDFDSDNDGEISFSTSHAKFYIDSDTGTLYIKDHLDYESVTIYNVEVTLTDQGAVSRSNATNVTISVTDVNDNSPHCSPTSYSKIVREDEPTGSTIGFIVCTDSDSDENGNVSYSIVTINDLNNSTLFSVNSSGVIVTTSTLDYETLTSYKIVINVTDNGTPQRSTTVTFNVAVSDVNEHDPVFSASTYSVYASEGSALGSGIFNVSATDLDTADTVYYVFNSTRNSFTIDYFSGEIKLKSELDKETTPNYVLVVIAIDSGRVDSSRSSTATVSITVLDENENPPKFEFSYYIVSLRENTTAGSTIITVNASDQDGDNISYSIIDGNTYQIFTLNNTSGIVTLAIEMDYENLTSHQLIVKAEDFRNLSSTATIQVNVLPYNEYTPVFSPNSSSVIVPENTTVGSVIFTAAATDFDRGNDGVVVYSINNSDYFAVESHSGGIKLTSALDKETHDEFVVYIFATDGGTWPSSLTSTYSLTVSISDVNDNLPTCTSTVYVITVMENVTVSSNVLQLSCIDGDNDADSVNNKTGFLIFSGNDDAKFDFNNQTGDLSIASTLDREAVGSYNLVVHVVDGGSPALTTTLHIDITVEDINDNQPVFENLTYQYSVEETVPLSTVVGTVKANDADSGLLGHITYSIESGNSDGKFAIDSSSGDVKLVKSLDAESETTFNLTVRASDGGSPMLSDTTYFVLSVIDVNDNTPVCNKTVLSQIVQENATAGSLVVQLLCTDDDSTSILYYELIGSVDDFAINSSSGVLSVLNNTLDSETFSAVTVYVNVTDQRYSTTVTIFISISDVNEFTPQFSPLGPYNITIAEDFPIAGTIDTVSALDGDLSNSTLIYTILDNNLNGVFTIGSNTGIIQLRKSLDAESVGMYILEIEVSDGEYKSSTNLTISVSDVNDNTPNCNPSTYSISYAEDTAIDSELLSLSCSDADVSGNDLVFVITSGNDDGKYNVNSTSGVIKLNSSLDYETTTEYTLTLNVSDTGSPSFSTSLTVFITVLPVNEEPPIFTSTIFEISITENLALNSEVITTMANDSDQGSTHGKISYAIASGDPSGHFSVDEYGKIKLARKVDREATDFYNLTLTASDSKSLPESLTSTTYIGVTVTDINDNYPQFFERSYSVSIYENAAIGATLLTLIGTDDDIGQNGVDGFTYSIISGNSNNTFNLTENKLILAADIDRETISLFQLQVRVQDNGSVPLSDNTYVNVQVLAFNEYAPAFSNQSQSITVSEKVPIGTVLYTFSASDFDTGDYGTLRYYIIDNISYSEFLLNEYSGALTVWSRLDYDTSPTEYNITIKVIDTGYNASDSKSDFTWIYIVLTDENDHSPTFSQNVYTFTVNENLAVGSYIGNVSATDGDSGINGDFVYSVVSGDGSAVFSINETHGHLVTLVNIDYEFKTMYSLVVQAKDNGSTSLSSQCLVKVIVNDMNDNAPVFQPDDFAINILENITIGTVITSMSAADADSSVGSNNVFTYNMTSDIFEITSTGVIIVSSPLDRENASSYILNITATDNGSPSQTGTATLTVLIDDINDNSPIVHGSYDVTISEDAVINTVVASVNATDNDIGVNSELTYSISDGNTDNDFKINSGIGIIQVANTLDRERTSSYILVVDISDGGFPPLSSTINVSIILTDLNDNGPIFTSTAFSFNVLENVTIGTEVGTVTANDTDSDLNAQITYSLPIFWSGLNSHIAINESNGVISTSSVLDRETQASYFILCKITDNGKPAFTSTVNITITVLDVNDNDPIFNASSFPENQVIGTVLLTFSVTDADEGVNKDISLAIDTSAPGGLIANSYILVNETSFELTVKQIIDRETTADFSFNLVATDGGSPSRSKSVPISFSVEDLNDNLPEFGLPFYNSEIPYNDRCHLTVTVVTATDKDENDTIRFSLINNNLFSINSTSGLITVVGVVDEKSKYELDVIALDLAQNNRTVKLRIDTFESESTMVTLSLSISRNTFDSLEQTFIGQLDSVIQQNYSTGSTRRWCIKEISDSSIDVSLYFLEDNTTNSESNIVSNKSLLTANSVRSILTKTDGSLVLTGGIWDQFNITGISSYVPTTSSSEENNDEIWITTPTGIAVISATCAMVAIGTALTAVLIKKLRVPKIKSPEEKLQEKRKELKNVDEAEISKTPEMKRQTMQMEELENANELDDDLQEMEISRKGTALSKVSKLSVTMISQQKMLSARPSVAPQITEKNFYDVIDKSNLPPPVIVQGPIHKINRKTYYRENDVWADMGFVHPNAVPSKEMRPKMEGKAERKQTFKIYDAAKQEVVELDMKSGKRHLTDV